MAQFTRDADSLVFSTSRLSGILDAQGQKANPLCNHRIRNLIHQPSQTLVTTDRAPDVMNQFGLSLFRIYARHAYLGELRATPYTATPLSDGIRYCWMPFVGHEVKVELTLRVQEPAIIDLELQVWAYATYLDYEILLSSYWAAGFKPGVYVASGAGPVQLRPGHSDVYDGMYLFFPRDAAAASRFTDGRAQRGRWCWRPLVAREYAAPMAFFANGKVDVLLMGRREDVFAVGTTYAGNERTDAVAAHRAMYLNLFGRDLHAGEGWRTRARVVVDDFGTDPQRHLEQYEQFVRETSGLAGGFEMNPYFVDHP